jgi:hypothetical protein
MRTEEGCTTTRTLGCSFAEKNLSKRYRGVRFAATTASGMDNSGKQCGRVFGEVSVLR